jgi:hypothetical protein
MCTCIQLNDSDIFVGNVAAIVSLGFSWEPWLGISEKVFTSAIQATGDCHAASLYMEIPALVSLCCSRQCVSKLQWC